MSLGSDWSVKRLLQWLISALIIATVVLFAAIWWFENNPSNASNSGKVDDEAKIAGLSADYFNAADEDYFKDMDRGVPLSSDEIKGRNTWHLWTGGNDRFWDYMANHTFGAFDLIKTLSSHPSQAYGRDNRWNYLGLLNEPCFDKATGPVDEHYGLWLDVRNDEECPPDPFADAEKYPGVKVGARGDTVPVGSYYGKSSGIMGLRLFPNPDFDEQAKRKWDPIKYYEDPDYYNDQTLVRPYRVGMTCSFCHVGPSPVNPPSDPENPEFQHMISNSGAQYFWVDRIFFWDNKPVNYGGEAADNERNFVFQLFHTNPPGSLDTSFVSTDNINNPRTMNAVYDFPARVKIAKRFGTARLEDGSSNDNVQMGDFQQTAALSDYYDDPYVTTPFVLKDGADSVGVLGALNRVYLNIGLFSEEWLTHFRALVGGQKISPIEISVMEKNSTYWNATVNQNPNVALFFLKTAKPDRLNEVGKVQYGQSSTAELSVANDDEPLSITSETGSSGDVGGLKEAIDPETTTKAKKEVTDSAAYGADYDVEPSASESGLSKQIDAADIERGKIMFAENCAACHSSKLPEPIADVEGGICEGGGNGKHYLDCWEKYWEWAKSESFKEPMRQLVLQDDFLENNYLSTDRRIPVTMLNTNLCSPLATNAIEGDIWDNFSSQTYKELPSVGSVEIQHPFTGERYDYEIPAGGRGFTRVASLVSLWSTAPYLLNNSVGKFHASPSVEARLSSFEDGIEKMLWPEKRLSDVDIVQRIGLNASSATAGLDGYMYRTTAASCLKIPNGYLPLPKWLSKAILGEDGLQVGPVPKGTPVNLLSNIQILPETDNPVKALMHRINIVRLLKSLKDSLQENGLKGSCSDDALDSMDAQQQALEIYADNDVADRLIAVSKCPDYVVNKGHYFGTDMGAGKGLSDQDKYALIKFLRTF